MKRFFIIIGVFLFITIFIFAQEAKKENIVGYVDDTSEGKRSLAASGHCEEFTCPEGVKFVESVMIFAGRYGLPEPPQEDFHVYILNDKQEILADIPVPYSTVERADMRWYTITTPAIEVPKKFFVAINFNPHQTKGIYLGYDSNVQQSHSFMGLPDSGFTPVKEKYDWMIRLAMTAQVSQGKKAMLLSDWKPPVKQDPFVNCLEIKYDNGKSDGMQSYGGSGPAISFKLSEFIKKEGMQKPLMLKGLKIFGSRYGSGYDTQNTMIKIHLIDKNGKAYSSTALPYSLFSYKEKWVNLVFLKPLEIKTTSEDFLGVAIDPEAHQTKGIYFHYNKDPKISHSMAGNVDRGFKPESGREWIIRACIE